MLLAFTEQGRWTLATQTVMGRETGRLFNRGARSDGVVQKIDYEGLMKWQMA